MVYNKQTLGRSIVGIALYRKYRSKTLAEVVGQDHVTSLLQRALDSNRISHAYLFTGPRGVGKTSIARILAHEINKLPYSDDVNHLDIIEIDAASNNGVEDVRDLRDKVRIAPVSAAKKVYIIDEVHMLSKPAFNALLKTLEEPPEHVVFILATTDVDKLPATIVSRTQRFGFRPAAKADIIKHLKFIAKKEGIKISDEALSMIAIHGDGSFRDSISLLDQLANIVGKDDEITAELIETSIGLAPHQNIRKIIDSLIARDGQKTIETLNGLYNKGIPAPLIADQLAREIQAEAATHPELLEYIDSLLDVHKSVQPELKLLGALRQRAIVSSPTKVKSAALTSVAPEITITIPELERKATHKKPSEPTPITETTKNTHVALSDFDWQVVVEHARKEYVALHSVISKCSPELEGSDLTLYTGNTFYKKKLDDPKYASLLSKCILEASGYELAIHTLPTAKPPQDSQAATAFAIMGGGEEVVIEGNGK